MEKIVHMNVCYFFNPLHDTLLELKRVLKPGGSIHINERCCIDDG